MTSYRVLLVEDDELLGVLLELVLAYADYRVTRVNSGVEALARLESDAEPIDAVISDIDLGDGPDGWEVARRARAGSPHAPVIYITGGRADEWAPQRVPLSAMLQKPFHIDDMLATLRYLLDAEQHIAPLTHLA